MCNMLCSALFEIVTDKSETPIVVYKEPQPKTSTESDPQSSLNESYDEKTSEGNHKESGYTSGE